jgi:hypothetical protein
VTSRIDRREHAAHRLLEIVFDLVNDLIEAQIDALVLGQPLEPFRRDEC